MLVVEGWLPDYVLEQALKEFQRGKCKCLITSGGNSQRGYLLSGYGTDASLAAAILRKMGMELDHLVETPALWTERNRTYESAREVLLKLKSLPVAVHGINIVSEGPLARRTHLVHQPIRETSARF